MVPHSFSSSGGRRRAPTLDRPDILLKSALEKVVFFECRLEQFTQDLAAAHAEVERLKRDLSAAGERELSLKHELAQAHQQLSQTGRERDDALERLGAARMERERILDKLLQAEAVRQAGEGDESLDLANFIAELRSEVLALRAQVSEATKHREPAPPVQAAPVAVKADVRVEGYTSAEHAASRFNDSGRLGVSTMDLDALKTAARFETRSEETLFSLSLRELSSTDAPSRIRAAQRLKTLGARPALPAVAATLNAEQDPTVACALLEAIAAAGESTALALVLPHCASASEEVRIAALEAAYKLKDSDALARAVADASAKVRRRAAVIAAGDPAKPAALTVLASSARDPDPSVRRVAALGLGSVVGSTGTATGAIASLLAALDDDDLTVRRAAAKGLSRAYGPEVFAIADLDAARRRREIRRLQGTSPKESVTLSLDPIPAAPAQAAVAAAVEAPAALAAPVAAEEPKQDAAALEALKAEVLGRVYAALRGQSVDDLVRGMEQPAPAVEAAVAALSTGGKLVRRGQRYFVP